MADVPMPPDPGGLAGSGFRTSEKVLIAYFFYIALFASVRVLPATRIVLAWFVAAAISALAWMVGRNPRQHLTILRDWIPLPLILVGYWELQWFASGRSIIWQQAWLTWDRHLLSDWGMRSAIEILGPIIPSVLETAYLFVYAIPPFCMAVLYVLNKRASVDRFLTTLLLGGFSAYALLPLFPVTSPRLAFPGADLPHFASPPRTVNLWLLNHFDISTSVFPSGHVAVAFSAAFGLWRALPEKRSWSYFLFVLSALVYIATIYSRYHYAVDGLAGGGIALFAWRISEWVEQHV